ncbi:hypothetical protein J7J90_02420 [Candidatus Micrarchaeota archaeon]|nr:hypothetical protein [Candidatus Micrarchaeota archaeon]
MILKNNKKIKITSISIFSSFLLLSSPLPLNALTHHNYTINAVGVDLVSYTIKKQIGGLEYCRYGGKYFVDRKISIVSNGERTVYEIKGGVAEFPKVIFGGPQIINLGAGFTYSKAATSDFTADFVMTACLSQYQIFPESFHDYFDVGVMYTLPVLKIDSPYKYSFTTDVGIGPIYLGYNYWKYDGTEFAERQIIQSYEVGINFGAIIEFFSKD